MSIPRLSVRLVISVILSGSIVDATWCFVCDTNRDIKCYSPVESFIHPPLELIANYSRQNVFAFTADSGADHNGNIALADVYGTDKTQYCDNTTGTSQLTDAAFQYCDYRPKGLRLVNCNLMLQLPPTNKTQCQKIVQQVGSTGKTTMYNTIRMCVGGGSNRVPLDESCSAQVKSNDGMIKTTTCTCSGDICNEGTRPVSSIASFLALLYFVVLAGVLV